VTVVSVGYDDGWFGYDEGWFGDCDGSTWSFIITGNKWCLFCTFFKSMPH